MAQSGERWKHHVDGVRRGALRHLGPHTCDGEVRLQGWRGWWLVVNRWSIISVPGGRGGCLFPHLRTAGHGAQAQSNTLQYGDDVVQLPGAARKHNQVALKQRTR